MATKKTGRIGSWFRGQTSGARTISAKTTHSDDTVTDVNNDTNAADVRAGLRGRMTGIGATLGKAKKAEKKAAQAEKKDLKRRAWEKKRKDHLKGDENRGWMTAIAIHGINDSRMGALLPWISQVMAIVATFAMLANDPFMVFNSVLKAAGKDPAEILTLLRQLNPDALIAIFSGIGTAGIILACVTAGSKGLAILLTRGGIARNGAKYPASLLSKKQLPLAQTVILSLAAILVLAAFTFYLHGVAQANYVASASSVLGGTSKVGGMIVLYVTALPWALLIVESISRILPFAHYRMVSSKKFRLNLREARDVRRDTLLLVSVRKATRTARLAITQVFDALHLTGIYLDWEAAESDMAGYTDLSGIADRWKGEGEGESATAENKEPLVIDRSGRVASLYLPALGPIIPTLADAINAFEALDSVPDKAPLQKLYKALHIKADEAARAWLRKADEASDARDNEHIEDDDFPGLTLIQTDNDTATAPAVTQA